MAVDIFLVLHVAAATTVPLVILAGVATLLNLFGDTPLDLKDQHVLVTGGSSGIGLCMAREFLEQGAVVTVVGRNADRLEAARASLSVASGQARVRTQTCDCGDAQAVNAMVRAAEESHGPVGVLVTAAGGASGGRFDAVPARAIEDGMRENYLTAAHAAHAVFPGMLSRGGGHICLVGSMASVMGVFGYGCYAPAKFAVRGLAEVLYYEGAHRGVGVTLVLPPDTDTPGYKHEQGILPPETLAISAGSGVFTPEAVARAAVEGVVQKRFRVTVGMDGAMLGMLTAGMTPGVTLGEVICMPFLRMASLFYVAKFRAGIRQAWLQRTRKKREECEAGS